MPLVSRVHGKQYITVGGNVVAYFAAPTLVMFIGKT